MDETIKIILVEDHELMRTTLKYLLKEYQMFEVVGEVGNGKELLDLLKKINADIVILDIEMPVMDGKETLVRMVRQYPDIKVIMLSIHNELQLMHEFIKGGARAYIPKSANEKLFIETLLTVYEKGWCIEPKVLESIIKNSFQTTDAFAKYSLSNRELEVLKEVCNGKTDKEIANQLKISEHTVHTHRQNTYKKTQTHTIAELVKYGLKNNLLQL